MKKCEYCGNAFDGTESKRFCSNYCRHRCYRIANPKPRVPDERRHRRIKELRAAWKELNATWPVVGKPHITVQPSIVHRLDD